MPDLPDPFREGLPDFEDPRVNAMRDEIVQGTELMKALMGTESIHALYKAVHTLEEHEARAALLATVMIWRASQGDTEFIQVD